MTNKRLMELVTTAVVSAVIAAIVARAMKQKEEVY